MVQCGATKTTGLTGAFICAVFLLTVMAFFMPWQEYSYMDGPDVVFNYHRGLSAMGCTPENDAFAVEHFGISCIHYISFYVPAEQIHKYVDIARSSLGLAMVSQLVALGVAALSMFDYCGSRFRPAHLMCAFVGIAGIFQLAAIHAITTVENTYPEPFGPRLRDEFMLSESVVWTTGIYVIIAVAVASLVFSGFAMKSQQYRYDINFPNGLPDVQQKMMYPHIPQPPQIQMGN